ncbi:MAG: GIY-YIG nuclease family protein [Castellaniella sp.]|uniref:GIY-YIG nuclease family protein n=1 Tax=Castellaniella sp. TaxID=1955812 RepID=UPI003A8B43FC
MNNSNIWLFKGSFEDARNYGRSIPVAGHLGYVYIISFSGRICKLGCTQNIGQRLSTYSSEMARYGRSASHCWISRPHFNYHAVEQQTLCTVDATRHGEVIMASKEAISVAVEKQHLDLVAPPDYGAQYRASHEFVDHLINELTTSLKAIRRPSPISIVQKALKTYSDLGRLSGLSPAESMINTLAVVEADTGLDLSTMRRVAAEVA